MADSNLKLQETQDKSAMSQSDKGMEMHPYRDYWRGVIRQALRESVRFIIGQPLLSFLFFACLTGLSLLLSWWLFGGGSMMSTLQTIVTVIAAAVLLFPVVFVGMLCVLPYQLDQRKKNQIGILEGELKGKDQEMEKRLEEATSELREEIIYLEERLKPKVEILFENNPPFSEFRHVSAGQGNLYHKVYHIAVKNIGGSPAYRLRAEFSGSCRNRTIDNLPLVLRGHTTNISEFDLSSSAENLKRIYVVMRLEPQPPSDAKRPNPSRPITILHQYGPGAHREMLCETEQHEITITVFGLDSAPYSRKFLIYVNEQDQLQMEPLDG